MNIIDEIVAGLDSYLYEVKDENGDYAYKSNGVDDMVEYFKVSMRITCSLLEEIYNHQDATPDMKNKIWDLLHCEL